MSKTSLKGLSPDWTGAPNLFLGLPMFIKIIVLGPVHMVKLLVDFGASPHPIIFNWNPCCSLYGMDFSDGNCKSMAWKKKVTCHTFHVYSEWIK